MAWCLMSMNTQWVRQMATDAVSLKGLAELKGSQYPTNKVVYKAQKKNKWVMKEKKELIKEGA